MIHDAPGSAFFVLLFIVLYAIAVYAQATGGEWSPDPVPAGEAAVSSWLCWACQRRFTMIAEFPPMSMTCPWCFAPMAATMERVHDQAPA